MSTFVIHTHGRLQEWVAEEKGYYAAEGLTDYVLKKNDLGKPDPAEVMTAEGKKHGAYESYETGRDATVSCACHWTVNMAASADHGTLWGECYSISPGAIMVPPESTITKPEQLAGVEVYVGYHSGSHYATIQSLEEYLPADQIKLRFGGLPDERVDAMIAREAKAANVFGMQRYILEQLGFRVITDTTFMIAGMVAKDADLDDVKKYYAALRRAQADIDVRHQKYVHYYQNELQERFRPLVDVRRFGPGERLIFEPYSKTMYDETHRWVEERGIFDADKIGAGAFEEAVALGEITLDSEVDFEAEHRVGHLLRRAYYRAKNNTGRLLKDVGITPMQAATVMTLHARGPLSQADLGRAIGMEPANVHGLVARLKKQALIVVEPHPTDQRQLRVRLSSGGERQAAEIAELSARAQTETLAPLAPAERDHLMALLGRIALD